MIPGPFCLAVLVRRSNPPVTSIHQYTEAPYNIRPAVSPLPRPIDIQHQIDQSDLKEEGIREHQQKQERQNPHNAEHSTHGCPLTFLSPDDRAVTGFNQVKLHDSTSTTTSSSVNSSPRGS